MIARLNPVPIAEPVRNSRKAPQQLAAGSPAAEQAALRALVYTPAQTADSITGFTLAVSDGIAPPTTDANTFVETFTSPLLAATPPIAILPNPGDANLTTASTSQETTTVSTPVAQTAQAYSTRVDAMLNGTQTVFDQTFALPYADPAVQAAVAQANSILAADGAAPVTPSLATSQSSNAGSQTSIAPTGQASTQTQTTAATSGPALLGPGFGDGTGYFFVRQGQTDTNTMTTVSQIVTTTTTALLSQQCVLAGTSPPAISSPSITVAENGPATAIGIAAPTDPNYTTAQLTIAAGTLPADARTRPCHQANLATKLQGHRHSLLEFSSRRARLEGRPFTPGIDCEAKLRQPSLCSRLFLPRPGEPRLFLVNHARRCFRLTCAGMLIDAVQGMGGIVGRAVHQPP